MADLSVTAGSVSPGTSASRSTLVAGESITAGQVVYTKASDGRAYKAQCDGTVEEAEATGIAVNTAGTGQPVSLVTNGSMTIGATVAIGQRYLVSPTAGGIAPTGDVTAGHRVSMLAIGDTTATLKVVINNSGVVMA